ncbi:MAG: GNAT family N-acetyltransferase [Actinomycetota bacterium]
MTGLRSLRADTSSSSFKTKDGRIGLVRPAQRGDARACLRIVLEATMMRPRTIMTMSDELWNEREWRRRMLDLGDQGITLVASIEGTVVGMLGASRGDRRVTRHVAELGITVSSDYRGIGVGRALMNAFEPWARSNGIERSVLGVYTTNDRARALYESVGYVVEGIERGSVRFPEGYADTIRMAKQLRD